MLAYFRTDQHIGVMPLPHAELVAFDIVRNTTTVLTDTIGSPFPLEINWRFTAQRISTLWSQDSQRIITAIWTLEGEKQALLLARDGTLINRVVISRVPLDGDPLGVTSDDQLVVKLEGDPLGVTSTDQLRPESLIRWLPLRPGDTPYAPDSRLVDRDISQVYLPPAQPGTMPPAYATATTPLPMTQLPPPLPVPQP
jgi:hypothetical protein